MALKAKLKTVLSAGVASSMLLTPAVYAGGDLDDHAELRAQLQALTERLAQLEADFDADKIYDEQHFVRDGNHELWVSLSGHVNRAVMYGYNGEDDDFFNVDNDGSSSRFRIQGGAHYDEDISIGTNIELQVESNSTAVAAFADSPNDQGISDRKVEFYVRHNDYGTLWLGQGNTASFLTGSVDLSDTDIVIFSDPSGTAGGLTFRDDDANVDGPSVGDVFTDFNGAGRDDRIRYDSPIWNGAMASISARDGGNLDGAIRWSMEFDDGTKAAAAVGASEFDRDTGGVEKSETLYSGSASILLNNGLNASVGFGVRDDADDNNDVDEDAHSLYAKLGYIMHHFAMGATAFAVDYAYTEDFRQDGDDAWAAGFAVLQHIDSIATEAYFGYRYHELEADDGGVDFEGLHAILAGARIKM